MRILKPFIYILVIFAISGSCLANENKELLRSASIYAQYMDILLDPFEMPNSNFIKTIPQDWLGELDANNMPREIAGFAQIFGIKKSDIMVRLQYAQFENRDEAHKAVLFHMANVAVPFTAESWPEAKIIDSADEIFFTVGNTTNALILRQDAVCVLISCHSGNAEENRKVAVEFACKVAGRLYRQYITKRIRVAMSIFQLEKASNSTLPDRSQGALSEKSFDKADDFAVSHKKSAEKDKNIIWDGLTFADQKGEIKAYAEIGYAKSAEAAQQLLFKRIVSNQKALDVLFLGLNIKREGPGNLCIVQKNSDKADEKSFNAKASFYRDNVVVCIRSADENLDAENLARIMDEKLVSEKVEN